MGITGGNGVPGGGRFPMTRTRSRIERLLLGDGSKTVLCLVSEIFDFFFIFFKTCVVENIKYFKRLIRVLVLS